VCFSSTKICIKGTVSGRIYSSILGNFTRLDRCKVLHQFVKVVILLPW